MKIALIEIKNCFMCPYKEYEYKKTPFGDTMAIPYCSKTSLQLPDKGILKECPYILEFD